MRPAAGLLAALLLWLPALGGQPLPSTGAQPLDVPPAQVQAAARQILSQAEYQPIADTSWLDPWLPTIERVIDWLFSPFTRRTADAGRTRDALTWALYGAVALTIVWLLVRLLRRRHEPDRPLRATGGLVTPPRRTAAEWRALAASADRPAQALPLLLQALWARLDETGRLAADPARTNHEAARAVAGEPALARPLAELAAAADAVRYGGRALDTAGYQRLAALVDGLWEGPGR